jgi:hypothetical protein
MALSPDASITLAFSLFMAVLALATIWQAAVYAARRSQRKLGVRSFMSSSAHDLLCTSRSYPISQAHLSISSCDSTDTAIDSSSTEIQAVDIEMDAAHNSTAAEASG